MPAATIKELRKANQLEAALEMAQQELTAQPENIWCKRAISWVYYDYAKRAQEAKNVVQFVEWLQEIEQLNFSEEEGMLFDNVSWLIGKLCFAVSHNKLQTEQYGKQILQSIRAFPFQKPKKEYSFILKGLHRLLKGTNTYQELIQWWNLSNLLPEDYLNESMPDGKSLPALAEQVTGAYTKALLTAVKNPFGDAATATKELQEFIPVLEALKENHPNYNYTDYYISKALFTIGRKEEALGRLSTFAQKSAPSWVWMLLAEMVQEDKEQEIACYCRALLGGGEEMVLVKVRTQLAVRLSEKKLYAAAKKEVELAVFSYQSQGFTIPRDLKNLQEQDWFKTTEAATDNRKLYNQYREAAESIVYGSIPEQTVLVEEFMEEKGLIRVIDREGQSVLFRKRGNPAWFKFGNILRVRLKSENGKNRLVTCQPHQDEAFRKSILKKGKGIARCKEGQAFAFVDDTFIPPNLVSKAGIQNGQEVSFEAVHTYNPAKKMRSWKAIAINPI